MSNRDGKLTIKVANAVAKCAPIVTASFLVKFAKCLHSKQVLPYPANYAVMMKELFLNSNEAKLCSNDARKSVFSGKIFAFVTSKQAEKYQVATCCGGGKIIRPSDALLAPSKFKSYTSIQIMSLNSVIEDKR